MDHVCTYREERNGTADATDVLCREEWFSDATLSHPRPRVSRVVGAECLQLLLNLVCGGLCLVIGTGTDLGTNLAMTVCCGIVHNFVTLGTSLLCYVFPLACGRKLTIRDEPNPDPHEEGIR